MFFSEDNFVITHEGWYAIKQTNKQTKKKLNQSFNSLNQSVVYWPSTRQNMPFQSDAPKGSDAFRWQLWEEVA